MVVLIISPSNFLRKLITKTIEGPHIFSLEAATGEEALFLTSAENVDLVLFDLQTEADLKTLAQFEELGMKIIVTAVPGPLVTAAMDFSCLDFIEKPFRQYEFRKQIYCHLQQQLETTKRLDNHSQ